MKPTRIEIGGQGSPQTTEEGPNPLGDPHAATQTEVVTTGGAEAEVDHGQTPDIGPQQGGEEEPDPSPRTPQAEVIAGEEIATVPQAEAKTGDPTTGTSYAN
jgi:hypothetical protein